ncbi:MAG: glycosyltransferase family 39 protein [Candidatus Rokubacteria bacterium]|nr:glycosyltransferase family 39 protein [Candidatus Rokubacteria bacterium]
MARHWLLLVLATVLCLGPFAGKAFHVDDPPFLWAARQIQSHPADFYGFRVNWFGRDRPMSEVATNPPLTSYYQAAAASLAGWSETALHLAFLLPSIAVVLGTYVVARAVCARPFLSALLALVTPAFVVSGTSVMSDMMLTAFWVWAAALWVRGLDRDSSASLAGAGCLAALATLTRYYGVSLVPLLLAHGLAARRRPGRWALWLLLPLGALAAYQWVGLSLYGRGLVLDAGLYAGAFRAEMGLPLWARAGTALAFAGGSLATVALCAPWCWSRRAVGWTAAAVAAATLVVARTGSIGGFPLVESGAVRWAIVLQLGLWILAGCAIVGLAAADVRRRHPGSLLLGLWVMGTLAFAGFFNWTVNARAMLPMAPAVAILLARRLEQQGALTRGRLRWPLLLPLAAGAALALWVAQADYSWAHSARQAAAVVHRLYGRGPGPLWFEGHWGFQYYMELAGGRAVDWEGARPAPGEWLVVPANNTNTFLRPQGVVSLHRVLELPSPGFMATMNRSVGAGFYSDVWGPLPFAVGRVPQERYYVFVVRGLIEIPAPVSGGSADTATGGPDKTATRRRGRPPRPAGARGSESAPDGSILPENVPPVVRDRAGDIPSLRDHDTVPHHSLGPGPFLADQDEGRLLRAQHKPRSAPCVPLAQDVLGPGSFVDA